MTSNHAHYRPGRRGFAHILPGLIIPAIVMIAAIYFVVALTNRDPQWFNQAFDERPTHIRIYHYGDVFELEDGQPGFEEMVAAVNSEISQHKGYYESLAPTGSTLAHYVDKGFAIELVYARPVQVHTRNFFPAAPNLMIAIDGSYNYVKFALLFRGQNEKWLPGGLALASVDRIRAATDAIINSN